MIHPLQNNPCTRHSCISGTWGLLWNVPKLLGIPSGTQGFAGRPQDVPDRFQGHFGRILGMFWADFRDFLGRFQGFSGQISGIFWAYIFRFDNHGNWWLDNMIIFPIHYFCIALNLNLLYKLQLKTWFLYDGFQFGFLVI